LSPIFILNYVFEIHVTIDPEEDNQVGIEVNVLFSAAGEEDTFKEKKKKKKTMKLLRSDLESSKSHAMSSSLVWKTVGTT